MRVIRYLIGAFLIALCIGVTIGATVEAHPGRTDFYGGHTCYTNCDYWGYSYGEYHYHNGGYATVDYYDQGYDYGSGEAFDNNHDYIVSNAKSEGEQAGYDVGYAGEDEESYPDAPDSICEIDFEFDAGASSDYQDGVYEGFRDSCVDLANDTYREAYSDAYYEGYAEYEAESEYTDNNSTGNDVATFFGWAFVVGIIGLFIYSAVKGD